MTSEVGLLGEGSYGITSCPPAYFETTTGARLGQPAATGKRGHHLVMDCLTC